jgi:hypothetical protein
VVRFYYRQRLFMGFCCVCCEILYLSLYLLHFPGFQRAPLVPLHLPSAVRTHLNGARTLEHLGFRGIGLLYIKGEYSGVLGFCCPGQASLTRGEGSERFERGSAGLSSWVSPLLWICLWLAG